MSAAQHGTILEGQCWVAVWHAMHAFTAAHISFARLKIQLQGHSCALDRYMAGANVFAGAVAGPGAGLGTAAAAAGAGAAVSVYLLLLVWVLIWEF